MAKKKKSKSLKAINLKLAKHSNRKAFRKGNLIHATDDFGENFTVSVKKTNKTKKIFRENFEKELEDPESWASQNFRMIKSIQQNGYKKGREDGEKEELRRHLKADYLFSETTTEWLIAYRGKTCKVQKSKGMHYIQHLLKNPNKEIHVNNLAQLFGDLSVQEAQAWDSYKETLNESGFDKEQYENSSIADTGKIIRLRLRKNISTSLRHIKKAHLQMGTYLENHIKMGFSPSYRPTEKINWKF